MQTDGADPRLCDLCKQGKVSKRDEQLRFHQWTRRGYVFCEVTVPISTCENCGAKTWDEVAEAMIEQAVREAYDKLS